MQPTLRGNTLASKQEDRWSINCWKDWEERKQESHRDPQFMRSLYHPAHLKELPLKSDNVGRAQIHSETGEILSVTLYFLGSHWEAGGTFLINSSKATWFLCEVPCKHQVTRRHVNRHLLRPHLHKTMFSTGKLFSLPKQGKKPEENRESLAAPKIKWVISSLGQGGGNNSIDSNLPWVSLTLGTVRFGRLIKS